MAHGTPDWGHSKAVTIYPLTDDLAELAARLGSIHIYDRRGNVIWLSDFADGLGPWEILELGTGAAVALETTLPKWPPNCVRLTGGSDDGEEARITNHLNPQTLGKLGLEVSVAFITTFNYFRMRLTYYDGTAHHQAAIELNDTDDKIYYLDENGIYVELDDLPDVVASAGLYHTLKLVADFSTDQYVRFLMNQNSYDLSAYSFYEAAIVDTASLRVELILCSREGENDYCHVDGVVVTQNEP